MQNATAQQTECRSGLTILGNLLLRNEDAVLNASSYVKIDSL